MPELSEWTLFIPIMLITFAAAFTQGCTGFGSALITMPLLTLILDFKTCVAFSVLQGLTISFVLMMQLRRDLNFKRIAPLSVGALAGALTGLFFLKNLDGTVLKTGLGGLLICFAGYTLLCRPRLVHIAPAWGILPGFLTGAISASCSAGGPPTLVYTSLTDWNKDEMKSTLTGFFFLNSVVVATGHVVTGMTTTKVLAYFIPCLLPLFGGIFLGIKLYGRIKTAGYRKALLCFLFVMGVLMAWPHGAPSA